MSMKFSQYVLQQDRPDHLRAIVDVITNNSIFLEMLGFQEVQEFSYTYNRRETLGGIAFRGFNETYTPDTGVVNPVTEVLKIFGGAVRTDRQLAKGPTGTTVRANNVAAKVKRAGLFFDSFVLNGDTETNPLAFDGLRKRLIGAQLTWAGTNGAQLTLAMVDTLLDRVAGEHRNKQLVCNNATRTKIKQLVLATAGGAAVADFKDGEIDRYNGAKIRAIDEDGDETPILGFNETRGSSNVTASMYCVRPGQFDGEHLRGLVRRPAGGDPVEHVDYGERNGVHEELVEGVMGIAVHHPRSAARLGGILAPA